MSFVDRMKALPDPPTAKTATRAPIGFYERFAAELHERIEAEVAKTTKATGMKPGLTLPDKRALEAYVRGLRKAFTMATKAGESAIKFETPEVKS